MTDSEILDTTLRSVLALDADDDLNVLAYARTETWDSVAHMQLILAIEEAFGITIDADDVVAMSTYAEATRTLRDHHGLVLGVDGR